ncbi:MAG: glycosyltransferase family 2 protein [Bacteroidia bacterium]|nr:glycosyltransferase family 2 protein [Bacteroidia bacterium]
MLNISIVVPLYNEDESLPELSAWIKKVMEANAYTYEILFIDDGSRDKSWEVIKALNVENPNIRGIKFRRNYGKSAALNVGFSEAKGDVVITMDADLQDSPDEIPGLYKKITEENFDLVSGWKKKRYDPITKTLPTKLFNAATRMVSGIKLNDFNCGLKAYKNEVVKNIEVYGEMHRYIPVLAKWSGFANIGEQVVEHRARKYGTTKFGLNRFVNGFLDLMTIFFMSKFGKKPMHFFGVYGMISIIVGFTIALSLGIDKLHSISIGKPERLITSSPWFFIGLSAIIIGTTLFVAGFLGEMISRTGADRNKYSISEETGGDKY